MSLDEGGTLRAFAAHRAVTDSLIVEQGGRIANTAGDGVVAEFPSAVDAVQCAVTIQEALTGLSKDTPDQHRLQFRVGVHVGLLHERTA